jgi:hypothetical protein
LKLSPAHSKRRVPGGR